MPGSAEPILTVAEPVSITFEPSEPEIPAGSSPWSAVSPLRAARSLLPPELRLTSAASNVIPLEALKVCVAENSDIVLLELILIPPVVELILYSAPCMSVCIPTIERSSVSPYLSVTAPVIEVSNLAP